MKNKATIAYCTTVGLIRAILCESYGSLTATGRTLLADYQSAGKVASLIDHGCIAKLGEDLESSPASTQHCGPVDFETRAEWYRWALLRGCYHAYLFDAKDGQWSFAKAQRVGGEDSLIAIMTELRHLTLDKIKE
jgi:hypothetical protein